MRASNRKSVSIRRKASAFPFKLLYLCVAMSGGATTAVAGQSKLVGVWKSEVQYVDCTSGLVVAPPGFALHTYYSDGNHLLTSAGNPATGNSGVGRWTKAGKNTFAADARILRFDANGFYSGYVNHERMITLAKDGQTLEYTNRASWYSVDDQYFFTSCAVGTAVRLPDPTPF